MAEYIERIDAIKAVNKQNAFTMTRVALIDSLNSIPAADVAPVVHGRWKWDTQDIYSCTNCNEKVHVKEVMGIPAWKYCPNCGAKMYLECEK